MIVGQKPGIPFRIPTAFYATEFGETQPVNVCNSAADQGHSDEGSERAGHGILSPDGTDSCSGLGKTFVRRCGAEDNPAEVLSSMYGGGPDPNNRKAVPDADVWQFVQQSSINALKNEGMPISGVLGTLFTEERMKD